MYQSLRTNELPDDYVVFDIETSGLNPKKDKIIEIGAIKYKDNKKIDEFSYLIDPEIKLNQIQDIVYNFSLADGIGKFLKIPEVVSFNIKEEIFLKKALDRFFNDFDLTYSNGTKSKIVF